MSDLAVIPARGGSKRASGFVSGSDLAAKQKKGPAGWPPPDVRFGPQRSACHVRAVLAVALRPSVPISRSGSDRGPVGEDGLAALLLRGAALLLLLGCGGLASTLLRLLFRRHFYCSTGKTALRPICALQIGYTSAQFRTNATRMFTCAT